MPGVRFSGPNNSTTFTTCCGCAIIEERCCPRCGEEITPLSPRARFDAAYAPYRRAKRARVARLQEKKSGTVWHCRDHGSPLPCPRCP